MGHTPVFMEPESMDPDTTVMPPVTVTTSARDLLMLIPKLKLNHGWLMLTTDTLDTHTLPHMPPHTDITSARDPPKLKPSQKPGTVLTDMQDTVIVPMLDTLHTAMDIVMLLHTTDTDTESKLVKKK